jgi:hypothetical protein
MLFVFPLNGCQLTLLGDTKVFSVREFKQVYCTSHIAQNFYSIKSEEGSGCPNRPINKPPISYSLCQKQGQPPNSSDFYGLLTNLPKTTKSDELGL